MTTASWTWLANVCARIMHREPPNKPLQLTAAVSQPLRVLLLALAAERQYVMRHFQKVRDASVSQHLDPVESERRTRAVAHEVTGK